jgi:hypothetical protein
VSFSKSFRFTPHMQHREVMSEVIASLASRRVLKVLVTIPNTTRERRRRGEEPGEGETKPVRIHSTPSLSRFCSNAELTGTYRR